MLRLGERLKRAPAPLLLREKERLSRAEARLPVSAERTLATARERLERAALRLSGLDPQRVLERGYAWLEDENAHPVTHADAVRPGQKVSATLADGKVDLTVLGARSR